MENNTIVSFNHKIKTGYVHWVTELPFICPMSFGPSGPLPMSFDIIQVEVSEDYICDCVTVVCT
jgi:hypothetical protein